MKQKTEEWRMRISFDLDEVLFVSPKTHKTEKELPFPWNKVYVERLRLGAPDLIRKLQELHYEVWIYTSSSRSEKYIKSLFRHYGVKFDGIVNAQRHEQEVQKGHTETLPQKLPNRYHISLHVDDEDVICSLGRLYGFQTYHLDAEDDEWKDKIIRVADKIRERQFAADA